MASQIPAMALGLTEVKPVRACLFAGVINQWSQSCPPSLPPATSLTTSTLCSLSHYHSPTHINMPRIKEVESEEEWQELLTTSGGQLIVADFWATWCGPCRMIGPHFERMSDEEEFTDVIFVKVDVDECGELAEEFDIEVMPTFFFFKKGEKIAEMSGANQTKLRELIEEHK